MTRVLVIGKDGRTDCIGEALTAGGADLSALSDFEIPGLRKRSSHFCVAKTDNIAAVLAFVRETKPDLIVVGPEEPLAAGVVDEIQRVFGIPCVGPTKSLARIESSKAFARRLLSKYGIAGNPEHRVFDQMEGIDEYLRELGEFVIKPDGLTGGKGVKVFGDHLNSIEEALQYAREIFESSKGPVIVEEKLDGEEFSFQSFCDGETVVDTIPVQDHKRALEGDRGPNTGGMGSYSCEDGSLPFLKPEHLLAAKETNAAVARALASETGEPYRGILYGGFMATASGVRLIEYNARFGDPEAMNVLPLLKSNFLELCMGIATGHLGRLRVEFQAKATVCKYLVPQGYPDSPVRNVPIEIPQHEEQWREKGVRMYYAAVRESGGSVILTGSRALAFVAMADSVYAASDLAEWAVRQIRGPVVHRSDIGTRALIQKRVSHMERLAARPSMLGSHPYFPLSNLTL